METCEECLGEAGGHHVWCSQETAPDAMTICWGCGKWSTTLYCGECFKEAKCPHDKVLGECNDCDVEGDLAFDSAREQR